MAENIAKIDEKIRELKRKKKSAENRELIRDYRVFIRGLNQLLKGADVKIEKLEDIFGFLQEQETRGKFVSNWVKNNRKK